MSKTITVEGDLSAADTLVNLTTRGDVTAPSRQTPEGAKRIDKVFAAVAPDLAAAGAAGFFIRIGGDAVMGGEQQIPVAGAGGAAVQSGADPVGLAMPAIVVDDADIDVQGQENIRIQAEMAGDDLGDAHIVVTLVFA